MPALYGHAGRDHRVHGEEWTKERSDAWGAANYHQPSDDLSRPVDWDSAVRFARANARIGYAIANEDERPAWNEGDFFGEKFGR